MPDMDGFETAEYIRGNKKTRHIPIIFVTAISKEQKHIFKGYESGAVDYIFKPLDPEILKSKVNIFLELFEQRRIIEQKNRELAQANREILAHQKALVEEERLKVLLQMAGAAAHELNQPLMILLGNLQLLELVKDDHEKILSLVPKIQNAGETISRTVKKIQNVRHDVSIGHDSGTDIINLDPEIDILAVEDSDGSYRLFQAYLKDKDHIRLHRAKTVDEAMALIKSKNFNLILLDYKLPDGTGLDLLEQMASQQMDLPVVAITGAGDGRIASRFMKAGAFDYLSKSETNKEELLTAIYSGLEKFQLKKEVRRSIKKMAEDSTRDQLTGLYNRRYMKGVLRREIERARRYQGDLCCLMLDLDHFKRVNDTYGHLCGDFVLQEFARRLKEQTRQSDAIFRYGGEEFIVLMPQTDIRGAADYAEKIRVHCHDTRFDFKGDRIKITVSIGISQYDAQGAGDETALIDLADKRLYQAKTGGRNNVVAGL
tara:strand:- start:823 stop:2280 length:1458 start_codon:yes stop_codon:yes gene_type:complete